MYRWWGNDFLFSKVWGGYATHVVPLNLIYLEGRQFSHLLDRAAYITNIVTF